MIEPTLDDDLYPDDFVCEILDAQPSGHPGIKRYALPEFTIFVWCDADGITRGVLTIDKEAAHSGWVTGGDFTIFVHPAWRRRGIATELYRKAYDYFDFDLEDDPLYTTAGAAWAQSVLETEAAAHADEVQS
jgi:GNAT superfamily N-acetyltransferase